MKFNPNILNDTWVFFDEAVKKITPKTRQTLLSHRWRSITEDGDYWCSECGAMIIVFQDKVLYFYTDDLTGAASPLNCNDNIIKNVIK